MAYAILDLDDEASESTIEKIRKLNNIVRVRVIK